MSITVLECRRFLATYVPSKTVRTVKDYEIDLELTPERILYIDNVPHTIRSGNICIRKPGQIVHGQFDCPQIKQSSILLTVDFSSKRSADHYSRNVAGPLQKKWNSPLIENLNGVIVPHAEHTFIPIYTELVSLANSDTKAAEILVMELLYRLNAEVCRQNYKEVKPPETPCSLVLNYIKNNLEHEINLEQLANMVHLDKNYLVRLFKETYGQTPINTLIDMRMERACDLITNTSMSISQIATACGYTSASYFTAEFKKRFGITPLNQRSNKIKL